MEALVDRPVSPAGISTMFWRDRRVLVTGHTGFKGTWLSLWLNRLGSRVAGLSLVPNTSPNLHDHVWPHLSNSSSYISDINNESMLSRVIHDTDPEIVFHLAAQPLVRESYRTPIQTLETNVLGTARLLHACELSNTVRAIVVVTTDKVYENKNWPFRYRESDTLGGHDPYSAGKAAAELISKSMYLSFLEARGIAVATARAGNVIGGGDWSPDRLLPDAVRAWSSNEAVAVRNPNAIRPWQHVLDPLAGYLMLAESLYKNPVQFASYNFAPDPSQKNRVIDVLRLAAATWGSDAAVDQGAPSLDAVHEAHRIDLDNSKAHEALGVWPLWNVEQAVSYAIRWYKRFYEGKTPLALCEADIHEYSDGTISRGGSLKI